MDLITEVNEINTLAEPALQAGRQCDAVVAELVA